MDMFLPVRFKTSVHLAPKELTLDFTDNLLKKLQLSLEGICTRHGYIKPGSLEIVRRSVGQFVKQHFNGHLRFDVVCRAEVCNPPQNAIVEAVVKNKNELGVHAESSLHIGDSDVPVLDIIIPKRAAGIQSEVDIAEVDVGDRIFVEVLGKRFQLNDRKISIIGRAVKSKKQTDAVALQGDDAEEKGSDDDADIYEEDDDISEMEGGEEEEDTEDKESDDDEERARTIEIDDEEDVADEEDADAEAEDEPEYDYDEDIGSEADDVPDDVSDIIDE